MNGRQPMGVLRSFSIKNIFYDKMDLRFLDINCTKVLQMGNQG